jgi:hypothetical protein
MRRFGRFSSHGRHDSEKSGLQEPARSGTLNLRETVTKLLCALALAAALIGPAAAEEQLVMPFACHVAGGKVLLAPSAPQTYQIYGHREQKRLTTCSPFDPRACHTWFIHRFDLDCGGARTSWQSVVAALGPMLAESVRPPGNAYNGSYGPAYAGRPGPGPAVHFPRGFAPNPMRVASFKRTETAPAPAHVPLPPKKPAAAAPAQVAEAGPNHAPAVAPSATGGKTEVASKTSAAPKAAEVAEHRALKVEVVSGSGETTGSLPKSNAASNTLWPSASNLFTLTLALLFASLATLFLGRRRMLTLPMPSPVARLRAPTPRPPLARTSHAELVDAADEPTDGPATRLRLWDETWLPGTMSEALDVLGVDPDASRDMIKSTVTRLRRALHPDYAIDEEDRLLRERRLKQINVAWEIVSARRHAPWLKAEPRSS